MPNLNGCSIVTMFCVVLVGAFAIGCVRYTEDKGKHGSDVNDEQNPIITLQRNEITWSEFTADRLKSTINNGRCAIVYVGYPFSMSPEVFSTILGKPLEGVDYFQIEADWSDPGKGNPFYNDFGVFKDGSVVVVFPDGTAQNFKFIELHRVDIAGILKKDP